MSELLQRNLRLTPRLRDNASSSDAGRDIRTVNAPATYARPSAHCSKAPPITKCIPKAHVFIHLLVKDYTELAKINRRRLA